MANRDIPVIIPQKGFVGFVFKDHLRAFHHPVEQQPGCEGLQASLVREEGQLPLVFVEPVYEKGFRLFDFPDPEVVRGIVVMEDLGHGGVKLGQSCKLLPLSLLAEAGP